MAKRKVEGTLYGDGAERQADPPIVHAEPAPEPEYAPDDPRPWSPARQKVIWAFRELGADADNEDVISAIKSNNLGDVPRSTVSQVRAEIRKGKIEGLHLPAGSGKRGRPRKNPTDTSDTPAKRRGRPPGGQPRQPGKPPRIDSPEGSQVPASLDLALSVEAIQALGAGIGWDQVERLVQVLRSR